MHNFLPLFCLPACLPACLPDSGNAVALRISPLCFCLYCHIAGLSPACRTAQSLCVLGVPRNALFWLIDLPFEQLAGCLFALLVNLLALAD